jgi:hypothetical protein
MAVFLDALAEIIDPIKHISTSGASLCRSLYRSFADGSTHETDVVIGGIESVASAVMEGKRLTYTDAVAYSGLVPAQIVKDTSVKTDFTARTVVFVGIGNVQRYRCLEISLVTCSA